MHLFRDLFPVFKIKIHFPLHIAQKQDQGPVPGFGQGVDESYITPSHHR